MPEATATTPPGADAGATHSGSGSSNSGARASLEALLEEVTALANQLRKTSALIPRQDNSPQGGWAILQALGRLGPQTVPDIARTRGLSRQNIQVLVNRLELEGYVVMLPNPAHKRSSLVELTERGRRSLATGLEQGANSMERLLPYVSQSRLVPAARLLRQLRWLLGGKELPPTHMVERYIIPPPARSSRRTSRRVQPAAAVAEVTSSSGPVEPGEGELPVSLL